MHLNGYKISAPTVFGRMSDDELKSLFWGYGYEPRLVSGDNLDQQMEEALDWAHKLIWSIKESEEELIAPRMPMIIMRTLKGWSGVQELNGEKIEGNCLSHQVVLTEAKTNPEQLKMLENWLKSYKFNELFDSKNGFGDFTKSILPEGDQRIGMNSHTRGGNAVYKPLNLPAVDQYIGEATIPGTIGSSSMVQVGKYLAEVFKLNEETKNFRFMSPDETYSNKLDAIFKSSSRAWIWPRKEWDKDMTPNGRVMEMLSEHNLQGLAQGYTLTGRHSVFASYEAFLAIITSISWISMPNLFGTWDNLSGMVTSLP